jgi:hypothetical protein
MLEKMARAMFDADSYDNTGRVWEIEGQQQAAYRAMARAALMAIREPSELALNPAAAVLAVWEDSDVPLREGAASIHSAIIDAILEGKA